MSSGKNSWTREVVCQAVIPIRIDPTATAEEAEEQVRQLIRERSNGVLRLDQLTLFALPLEDEDESSAPITFPVSITGGELSEMGGIPGVTEEDVEEFLKIIKE